MADHKELGGLLERGAPRSLATWHGVQPERLVLPRPELLQPSLALRQVRVEGGVQSQHVGGPGGGGDLQAKHNFYIL